MISAFIVLSKTTVYREYRNAYALKPLGLLFLYQNSIYHSLMP